MPKKAPWFETQTGAVEGLEPWGDTGDWSDYGAAGAWGGTAETNPWLIPGPIGDYGEYSLGYEGTGVPGPGLGPDGLMPFNLEDLGETSSGLSDILEGSDYSLQFDPLATARRSWRPTYGIEGPEGDTGYHISRGGGGETLLEEQYAGFPWVGYQDPNERPGVNEDEVACIARGGSWNGIDCDMPPAPPEPPAPPTPPTTSIDDLRLQCELAGGTWTSSGCTFPGVEPTINTSNIPPTGPAPGAMDPNLLKYPGSEMLDFLGQIPYSSTSAPLTPGPYQDIFTQEVAADPLSRKANLALEDLIHRGGVVATPFTSETEGAIKNIIQREGQLLPTEAEATVFKNLSDAVQNWGEAPLTTTEAASQGVIKDLLASGGVLPQDQARQAMAIEAARSPLDRLRAAQLSQGQAALADRGLLGQGPEVDYMERLETQLAPMYTEAAQQIALEEGERSDARYRQALDQLNQQAMTQRLSTDQRFAQARSLQTDIALDRAQRQDSRLQTAIQQAANLTVEQSRNLVNSINALTGVQQMRTDAALEVLDRNMEWNKFLAEYGLERDRTMAELQQGRYEFLLPLLQEYFKAAAMAAEGYVSGTREG